MERLSFEYPACESSGHRAHVGVVASGDLEVLLEPLDGQTSVVTIVTSVDGYSSVWKAILDRFFSRHPGASRVIINDFGATPGTVSLRMEQAVELSQS